MAGGAAAKNSTVLMKAWLYADNFENHDIVKVCRSGSNLYVHYMLMEHCRLLLMIPISHCLKSVDIVKFVLFPFLLSAVPLTDYTTFKKNTFYVAINANALTLIIPNLIFWICFKSPFGSFSISFSCFLPFYDSEYFHWFFM